jgi:hypothetical protein
MPKPVYATYEDIEQAIAGVNEELKKVEKGVLPLIRDAERRLQGAITALNELVEENQTEAAKQMKKGDDDNAALFKQKIDHLRTESFVRMDDLTETRVKQLDDKLQPRIEQTGTVAQQNLVEGLESLKSNMEPIHADIRREIEEVRKALQEEFNQKLEALKAEIEPKFDKAKKEAKERSEAVQKEQEKEIRKVRKDMQTRNEELDNRRVADNETLESSVDEVRGEVRAAVESAARSLKKAVEKQDARSDEIKANSEHQLKVLDDECDKLRSAVSEVENTSTRKVDWIIQDVSKRLRPTSASKACLHKSWFSPRFNIAGAHGLQLEVQLYRPADPPAQDQDVGDTAVFLWACKGMSLVFRLYIGNKYHTCEKIFNGRVPFGTRRMCFLRDQINRADDTLKISVEILECHRTIDRIIELPPPPESDEPPIPGLEVEKPLEGKVQFHRYINNRMYEQVKGQIDLMRSRMVRRVEWRIEQASKLRACFPPGECICSSQFMAAGIEGLQLMFYPCGYKGTTEGFCSLFVYGPAGCTIKCFLCLGAQKREANHSFAEPGAFGRTNFCRFDSIIDESDNTVLVAIDVEEAHMDSVAKTAHPIALPGDRRTQAQLEGSREAAVQSVIKLASTPGKTLPGLDHVTVLPSLWTAAMKDSIDQPGDHMRSFDELKKGQVLAGGSSPAAGSGGSSTRIPRAHSTPSFAAPSRNPVAAAAGGAADNSEMASPPLPPLPQAHGGGGGECIGTSSGSARRRQRRPGPGGTTLGTTH